MPKRRVVELPPPVDLALEEARDVVPRREGDRPRLGLEGLHEHLARRIAAAAPGELRQELERALLGTEVRQAETEVGVDDGGQATPPK